MPVSEEPMTAPGIPTWLAKLPRNEVLKLRVQEKEIVIPRLATVGEPIRALPASERLKEGTTYRSL